MESLPPADPTSRFVERQSLAILEESCLQESRGQNLELRRACRQHHRSSIAHFHLDVGGPRRCRFRLRGRLWQLRSLAAAQHQPGNPGEQNSTNDGIKLRKATPSVTLHGPSRKPRGITKANTIFRNYTTARGLARFLLGRGIHGCPTVLELFARGGNSKRLSQRISASECSSAPRFGAGIAPTSLATQAPTRFATSFIRPREAPCRYSCTQSCGEGVA